MKNSRGTAPIQTKQAELAQEYQIQKDDIIKELRFAIECAKLNGDAGTMIWGCVEIAKIMGLYEHVPTKLPLPSDAEAMRKHLATRSTEELLEMLASETLIKDTDGK